MKEIIKSEYHNLIGNKHKLVPASPKKTKKKNKNRRHFVPPVSTPSSTSSITRESNTASGCQFSGNSKEHAELERIFVHNQ